ncbi:MAG: thymidylate kinase [Gemmatimonadota bacterium]|jgi:dTMP kinase
MPAGAGALIVLEGTEGVGKTTQLGRLAARMQLAGIPHSTVREPGGTPAGDEIRRLLLDPAMHIIPRAEALLFMASRAQLVDEVIRPAIARGHFVVLDRFFLSTYAYQIAGRRLAEGGVRDANAFATAGLVPDLTILLDLPDGEGFARIAARGEQDRIERSGDAFHTRVAAAFRAFAEADWQVQHPECGPVTLVDASGSVDDVAGRIWARLVARWPETFLP